MNTYETLFITKPDLTEEAEQAVVDALAVLVTEGGGTMIANDRMGRRRLAYPIEKVEEGVYTRFLYDSDSPVPQEIERRVRLSDQVLRSLTVRLRDEWADDSKKQAVIDAERRIQEAIDAKAKAEAEALEAEAKAKAEAEAAAAGESVEGESAEAEPAAPAPAVDAPVVKAAAPESTDSAGEAPAPDAGSNADEPVKDSTPDAVPADGAEEEK